MISEKSKITQDQFYRTAALVDWCQPLFAFAPEEPIFLDTLGRQDEIAQGAIDAYRNGGGKGEMTKEVATKMLNRTRFFYCHFGFEVSIDGAEFYLVTSLSWSFGLPGTKSDCVFSYYAFTEESEIVDFVNEVALIYEPKAHNKTIFDLNVFSDISNNGLSFTSAYSIFLSWAEFLKSIYFIRLENSASYIADFKEIAGLIREIEEKDDGKVSDLIMSAKNKKAKTVESKEEAPKRERKKKVENQDKNT